MPPPSLHSRARLRAAPLDQRVVVKLRGHANARVRDVVQRVMALHVDMGATRAQSRELRARLAVDTPFFDAWCRDIATWCPLAATVEEETEEQHVE